MRVSAAVAGIGRSDCKRMQAVHLPSLSWRSPAWRMSSWDWPCCAGRCELGEYWPRLPESCSSPSAWAASPTTGPSRRGKGSARLAHRGSSGGLRRGSGTDCPTASANLVGGGRNPRGRSNRLHRRSFRVDAVPTGQLVAVPRRLAVFSAAAAGCAAVAMGRRREGLRPTLALIQRVFSNPRWRVHIGRRRRVLPRGTRTGMADEWPPSPRRSPPAPSRVGSGRGRTPRGRVQSRCATRGCQTPVRTRSRRRTSVHRRRCEADDAVPGRVAAIAGDEHSRGNFVLRLECPDLAAVLVEEPRGDRPKSVGYRRRHIGVGEVGRFPELGLYGSRRGLADPGAAVPSDPG